MQLMAGTWVFTEDESFVVSDDVGMLELFTYDAQLADNVPDARLSLLRRLAPRRVHRTYLQHQHPPSILRMFRTRRIIMRTQFNFVYTSKNQALKAKAHKTADLQKRQEAQRSPRDRAMRRVNWNLANCHATVQQLLIRQVLTESMEI